MSEWIDFANGIMLAAFERHGVPDVVENRIAFLSVWLDSWEQQYEAMGIEPDRLVFHRDMLILEIVQLQMQKSITETIK